MGIWAELTGQADREREARWKASDEALAERAREREAAIPPGYEWVWRSLHDNPMRFPACVICGATVEMPNMSKHTDWHQQQS